MVLYHFRQFRFFGVGDAVAFNWKAANGADAFDVYAYLLNAADGSTIELLDETADGSTDFRSQCNGHGRW